MKAIYYKPSGKFSPLSLVYFIILSATLLPLLALLYSYCIWYIPFVYINLFITIGFGMGIGLIIASLTIKKGKVRNPTLALLLGVTGGLVALYFNWAIWANLVINSGETYGSSRIGITVSNVKFLQVFSLITQPAALLEFIKEIGEYGTWGIRGTTIRGTFLYIIWFIEALIVIGVSAALTWQKARTPFCEISNTWSGEKELSAFNRIKDKGQLITSLTVTTTSDLEEALSTLGRIEDPETQDHSIFTVHTSDQGQNYLSVQNKIAKENKKGEIRFESNNVLEYIAISRTMIDLLEAK